VSESWKTKEGEFIEACGKLGLAVEVAYSPFQDNVPSVEMTGGKPKGLTQHETGNFGVGADARAQRNWVAVHHGGGSPNLASFTMSTDDKRCVLICRLNYRNYHAGKPLGNSTHGSNELCVNADGNWSKAKDNAAKANAAYLYIFDLSANDLVQHNVWYGKDCPYKLRHEGSWQAFVQKVAGYLRQLKGEGAPPPEPPPSGKERETEYFPQTGHSVGGAIARYFWQGGGVAEFGFPKTQEIGDQVLQDGQKYTVQIFQRALLHWNPRDGSVGEGLIGDMYLDALAKLEQMRVATVVGESAVGMPLEA